MRLRPTAAPSSELFTNRDSVAWSMPVALLIAYRVRPALRIAARSCALNEARESLQLVGIESSMFVFQLRVACHRTPPRPAAHRDVVGEVRVA